MQAALSTFPFLPDFSVRLHAGIFEIPVHHMRGGTSTGLIIWDRYAPRDIGLCEELLRHLMGVPLSGEQPGNQQLTGLGRGSATSNKIFIAGVESGPDGQRLVSTLAQLASYTSAIDWSVNCGNMSAALPFWALDTGLVQSAVAGLCSIDIRNTNTGVVTTSRVRLQSDATAANSEIPGIVGEFPGVDLFLHDPVGSKTGLLFPTGKVQEDIFGYTVSCVDVAVPMVIAEARQFGKTAREPVSELESDRHFMAELRRVWVEAGLRMGLKAADGTPMTTRQLERSETVPKVCIVGVPVGDGNLSVRYFTPQTGHSSLAVSGGCCLASAALVPGTVAYQVARGIPEIDSQYNDYVIGIENPAGTLTATIVARKADPFIDIQSAAYRRNAQILLRGHMPLYRASSELRVWLAEAAGRYS
jgi:2-methylaconitate cis-trans-isomerase PrpF